MLPKKVSFQLSSEQSVGDVWIAQLDRKRVPQARSSGCKTSVAVAVPSYIRVYIFTLRSDEHHLAPLCRFCVSTDITTNSKIRQNERMNTVQYSQSPHFLYRNGTMTI